MADVKQVYTIVNSIAEEALGMKDLEPIDTSFVSVGNEVLKSDENTEAWYGVLTDRIGRTVMGIRAYSGRGASLRREGIDFGIALQKLYIPLPEARENDSWNGQDEEAADPYEKFALKPKQKLFAKMSTWEFDATIPDVQLKTAFKSAEAMGAFIDGLFTAAYNAMELSYENMANLCRASFIARKSKSNNGVAYINLLSEYNTISNASLTAANAIYDKEFLRFSARLIKLYTDRLSRMSTLFNDEEAQRHTPKDLQVVNVLSDFGASMTAYLEADTFHDELVKLPLYEEVPFWQGSGESFSFEDTSKISVKYDGTNTVEVNGVVAVIYDLEAMGVTIENKRTKSIYNPRGEYTNYFHKADMGYYTDMSENGVVFYIGEA